MNNFFRFDFWFNLRPGVFLGSSMKILVGFVGLFIILSIVAGLGKKKWSTGLYSNFWKNLYNFFLTNAIIGLILTFFNYEMAPLLSARFWFLLWAAELIVWSHFIYKLILKIPQKKAQLEKEKQLKKYLP